MSKEIALKFESQLSKYYLQTIKDLLEEQEINPQQFIHMAVNQIKRNSRLLQVFNKNPASVFSSILTCAEFGLSPTAQMGECWLIPYGNECQFQIGYQGLSKFMYRNPDVQNISSECVYENDDFEYESETEDKDDLPEATFIYPNDEEEKVKGIEMIKEIFITFLPAQNNRSELLGFWKNNKEPREILKNLSLKDYEEVELAFKKRAEEIVNNKGENDDGK